MKYFQKEYRNIGWRKYKSWASKLKNAMRQLGKVSSRGGKNKDQRVKEAASNYLEIANALNKKIEKTKSELPLNISSDILMTLKLEYYLQMLQKHIDLVDRRILQGQTIPNEEKLYSIFETYTDFVKKGKFRPNVELGKKLSIATDQFGLILHHKVWDNVNDSKMSLSIATPLVEAYHLQSISFDKGFWNNENKEVLELYIPTVVMPKRGKRNIEQQQEESDEHYKELRNKHQAVESNINELEHRSLGRCPDRGYRNFSRYCALGVCAYNLHKIGAEMMKQKLKTERKAKAAQKAAA